MKNKKRKKVLDSKLRIALGSAILMLILVVSLILLPNIGTSSDKGDNKPHPPSLEEEVEDILKDMTLEEKVAQLFIITPEELTGFKNMYNNMEKAKNSLKEFPVGGLIYFSDNITAPADLKQEIGDIKGFAQKEIGIPLFISIDEEGGYIARIGNNLNFKVETFPPLNNISSKEEAFHLGDTIGYYLKELGFNLNFAPVADVFTNPENTVIRKRAFSSDPLVVAELVAETVKGFNNQGIISTLKHFPGHGNTTGDTHYGFAYTEKNIEELRNCELIPFKRGIEAGAEVVMLAHISAPNIVGDNTPCSFSAIIIEDLLRKEIGFKGVVITDALNMGAIVDIYSADEAAVKALNSGVDILLIPEDFNLAYKGLLEAVKQGLVKEERIDEALRKILLLKKKNLDF